MCPQSKLARRPQQCPEFNSGSAGAELAFVVCGSCVVDDRWPAAARRGRPLLERELRPGLRQLQKDGEGLLGLGLLRGSSP